VKIGFLHPKQNKTKQKKLKRNQLTLFLPPSTSQFKGDVTLLCMMGLVEPMGCVGYTEPQKVGPSPTQL